MSDSSSDRNPIEVLAEEFLARQRRGEKLTLDAFANEHPHLADDIRDLFPALLMMEEVRPAEADVTGPLPGSNGTLRLERLGDYRVLREVGRGGMGVVYEAEQESLGRHVALKVLPSQALLDAKQIDRFVREAKAAARLHHTNIVPVYGVGHQDGYHYYVMQFIQGLGLDEVLSELRNVRKSHASPGDFSAQSVARSLLTGDAPVAETLPAPPTSSASMPLTDASQTGRAYWQSVARLGIQVAQALAHAHQLGVVHRDVKPSNLLLDAHGNVWVTDFGLAKASDTADLTSAGEVVGTLRYIPPERFQGHSDARGDIYSLGLTLYELLTLKPAFSDEQRHRLIERILHDEPTLPRKLNPDVPRDLETIILKATNRDPQQRYSTAAELAEDLERFVEDRPIRARRISPRERLWRWCKRNPALASTVCLAATALVGVALLSLLFARAQTRLVWEEERNTRELRSQHDKLINEQEARAAVVEQVVQALDQQKRQSARMAIERAQGLLDQQEVPQAMLWYGRALSLAPPDDDESRQVCRASLAALSREVPTLRAVLPSEGNITQVSFSADGQTLLVGGVGITFPRRLLPKEEDAGRTTPQEQGELAFSGVTATAEHSFRLWSVATGQPLGPTLRVQQKGFGPGLARQLKPRVELAPDGRTLAVTVGGRVELYDGHTGQRHSTVVNLGESALDVIFRPDGRAFLSVRTRRMPNPPAFGKVDPDDKTPDRLSPGLVELQLWDTATGRPLGVPFQMPRGATNVEGVRPVFSPDGRKVLTGYSSRQSMQGFVVWDPASGKKLLALQMPDNWPFFRSASFAGDTIRGLSSFYFEGQTQYNYRLHFWDAATGKPSDAAVTLQPGITRPVGGARPSPRVVAPASLRAIPGSEGRTLLTLGRREARLWDVYRGTPVSAPLTVPGLLEDAALSPDGQFVSVACQNERTGQYEVRLWQLPRSPLVRLYPAEMPTQNTSGEVKLDFSRDGKTLLHGIALRGDRMQRLRLWEVSSARQIVLRLPALAQDERARPGATGSATAPLLDLCLDADGKTIRGLVGLSGRGTRREAALHAWDVRTGHPVGTPVVFQPAGEPEDARSFSESILTPRFAADGRSFLARRDGKAQRFDAVTGQPLGKAIPLRGSAFALHPDGRSVACITNVTRAAPAEAQLWDLINGQMIGAPTPLPGVMVAPLPGIVVAPPGPGVALRVGNVQFAPDGKTYCTVTFGREVRLWDATTGKLLPAQPNPQGGENSVVYSPDSKSLLLLGDNVAQLWDVATAKPVGEAMPHTQVIHAACFSPDSKTILTGSNDQTARLWDARTGRPVGPPLAHPDPVTGVAFHPDGRSVVTACEDGVLRMWEVSQPDEPDAGVADHLARKLGMRLSAEGAVHLLDLDNWAKLADAKRGLARPGAKPLPWHLDRVCASQNHAMSAAWHLDRHLQGHPNDSFALVLRARYWADSGSFPKATETLKRALAHGPAEAILPWLARYESMPANSKNEKLREWLRDAMVWVGTRDVALLRQMVGEAVAKGDYKKALELSRRACEVEPERDLVWRDQALLHLYLHDQDGYRKSCQHLLKLARNPGQTAQLVLLVPDPVGGLDLALEMADRVLSEGPAWGLVTSQRTTRGMAAYRLGEYHEAVAWLEKGLANRIDLWVNPLGYSFLAMAYHHLGQTEEAKKALADGEAAAEIDGQEAGGWRKSLWQDRLKYEIAHREAVRLVRGTPRP